jgi:mRNA interferase RelE/StbE
VAVYTVEARPRVRKALRQLDPTARKEVLAKMRALATDPRPQGTKPLRGYSPWLRARVGDYRIIYAVDDQARTVTVADVGHRREIYRDLDL